MKNLGIWGFGMWTIVGAWFLWFLRIGKSLELVEVMLVPLSLGRPADTSSNFRQFSSGQSPEYSTKAPPRTLIGSASTGKSR
ncbi:hypothetical protein CMV_007807 [Castanea mollissima]|uniref:Uncharacterized protein n=1 Tax=Castanea mollissima TaxID=60419 RepID=A0A8J4RHR0_9ROSI|nr:hypothetical protein CMV_007807 [Castanea mollissima]